jgi:hypothetical protein
MRRSRLVTPALLAACLAVACSSDKTPTGQASSSQTAPATSTLPPSQPSQSPQEALRDAVVPAVAALSFEARVGIVEREVTPEGTWALSRMPTGVGDSSSGSIGSGTAYARTIVSAYEYGEVLLLDRTSSRILRAFPLPGLPPQRLLVTPSAIFCERQGDGGLPDSMLCRIDRTTLRGKVRVFPWTSESGFHPVPPDRYVPSNWSINNPFGRAMFQTIRLDGRSLIVTGDGVEGRVDAATLRIEAVT